MGSSVSGICVGSGVGVAVLVGSAVCVGAVVPVLVWALTTTPPVRVFVVVLDGVVLLSCSDVTGAVDGSVELCVLVVVVLVLVSVDPAVAGVSVDGGFEVVSSAEATPYPVAIAVPTPNATASPPTRPI
ncbi:MAG: hypothetical protein ACJ74F_35525 [Mycobacterium sp.]|uniref:hypothetical protein n=1 Tax=Mycobacterium sp. TaxID=1785 RepID=UPI00389A4DA6